MAYTGEWRGDFADRLFLTARHPPRRQRQLPGLHDLAHGRLAGAAECSMRPHASVGTAVKLPDHVRAVRHELQFFVPNPNLTPEESFGWDAGIEFTLPQGRGDPRRHLLSAPTSRTRSTASSSIRIGNFTAINLPGESTREGVEVAAALQAHAAALRSAAPTPTRRPRPRRRARGAPPAAFGRAPTSPTPSTAARHGQPRRHLQRRHGGQRLSRCRSSSRPQRVTLDAYWLVNAAASYKLQPGVEMFGRVENLLDQHYQEVFGFEAAPIAAYRRRQADLRRAGRRRRHACAEVAIALQRSRRGPERVRSAAARATALAASAAIAAGACRVPGPRGAAAGRTRQRAGGAKPTPHRLARPVHRPAAGRAGAGASASPPSRTWPPTRPCRPSPRRPRASPSRAAAAEDVLRYDPDLVLAGPFGVSATVDLLRRLGAQRGGGAASRRISTACAPRCARWPPPSARRRKGEAMIAAFDRRLARAGASASACAADRRHLPGRRRGVGRRQPGRRGARRRRLPQQGGGLSPDPRRAGAARAAGRRAARPARAGERRRRVPHRASPTTCAIPCSGCCASGAPRSSCPGGMWLCGTPHIADAIERLAEARAAHRGAPADDAPRQPGRDGKPRDAARRPRRGGRRGVPAVAGGRPVGLRHRAHGRGGAR